MNCYSHKHLHNSPSGDGGEVTEMDNVHKLSQNRDEKSYDNIVQQLKQQEGDANEIGELMEKRKEQVFK